MRTSFITFSHNAHNNTTQYSSISVNNRLLALLFKGTIYEVQFSETEISQCPLDNVIIWVVAVIVDVS